VLADPLQEAEARDRLGELEVTAVDGYGGGGAVSGPGCTSGELALLAAEVAAAPHRFVAREPVPSSTVPSLVDGVLAPAAADLRVFVATGRTTTVLPAALSRVAATGADKDTWLPA
jgi:carboxylate-amine ligase